MPSPSDAQLALLPLVLRTLLAALFLYIYRRKRERYLVYWAAGWALLGLQYVAHLLSLTQGTPEPWLQGLDSLLLAFAALLFLDSAFVFSRGTASLTATAIPAPVLLLWLFLQLELPGISRYLPL